MPTVLITGGTRGIGLALGKAFAQKGWLVEACYDRNEASASTALKEFQSLNPTCQVTRCDVRKPDEVETWVNEVLVRYDTIECSWANLRASSGFDSVRPKAAIASSVRPIGTTSKPGTDCSSLK